MEDKRKNEPVYSKKIRAGRRRTYFFDIRPTRANDYYLTITESKRRYNEDGYDRHKIFLYKEDFNKFIEAMQESIDHVKQELLPEYDFDEFSRRDDDDYDHDTEKKPGHSTGEMPDSEDVGSKEGPEYKAQDKLEDESTDEGSASDPAAEDEDLKWD